MEERGRAQHSEQAHDHATRRESQPTQRTAAGGSVLTGCPQDSWSHTPVASGKRDRREGHDRRERAQMDLGRGTEGCSLGTFALTVNMNVGQYRESLSAKAAPGHWPWADS